MVRTFRRLISIFLAFIMLSADICVIAEGVTTLTLPSALQIIESEAFYGNTSIGKVIVPEGTTEIRSNAFAYSSLTELELPATLEFIAEDAFDGCGDFSVSVPEDCYAYNWCIEHGLIDESPFTITLRSTLSNSVEIGSTGYWVAHTSGGSGSILYKFDIFCNGEQIAEQDFNTKNYYTATLNEPGIYTVEVVCQDSTGAYSEKAISTTTVLERAVQISGISCDADIVCEGDMLTWNVETLYGKMPLQFKYEVLKDGISVSTQDYSEQNSYSYTVEQAGSYVLNVECMDGNERTAAACSDAMVVYTAEQISPSAPEVTCAKIEYFATTEESAQAYDAQRFELAWNPVEYANGYILTLDQKQNDEWISAMEEQFVDECSYILSASLFSSLTESTLFRLGIASQGLKNGETQYLYFTIVPVVMDDTITVNGAASTIWNQSSRYAGSKTFTIDSALAWEATSSADWVTWSASGDVLTLNMAQMQNVSAERTATVTVTNGVNSVTITVRQDIADEAPVLLAPQFSSDASNPTEMPTGDFFIGWEDFDYNYIRLRVYEHTSGTLAFELLSSDYDERLTEAVTGYTFKANTLYRFELAGVYSADYALYEDEDAILKSQWYVYMTDNHSILLNEQDNLTIDIVDEARIQVFASNFFTYTTDVDWLTVDASATMNYDASVDLVAAFNATGADRTGHVYFTCGSATATLTVNQAFIEPHIECNYTPSQSVSNPTVVPYGLLPVTIYDITGAWGTYASGVYTTISEWDDSANISISTSTVNLPLTDYDAGTIFWLRIGIGNYSNTYYFQTDDSLDFYWISVGGNRYRYNISLPSHAFKTTVKLRASGSWTASSDSSWLSATPVSGSKVTTTSGTQVTVIATKNTTGKERTGIITFDCKGIAQCYLYVTQSASGYVKVYDYDYYVSSNAGSGSTRIEYNPDTFYKHMNGSADYLMLYIYSNYGFTGTSNADWLTIDDEAEITSTSKSKLVTIDFTENTTGAARTGTVTFTGGDTSVVVSITQEPKMAAPEVTILSPAFTEGMDTDPGLLTYGDIVAQWSAVDNAEYYVVSYDWSTYTYRVDKSGASSYTFTIPKELLTVDTENYTKLSVKAYNEYGHSGGKSYRFYVVSDSAMLIDGKPDTTWTGITDAGASKTFAITSTADWTATSDSWITLSQTSGASGDSLTVTVDANSGDARTGHVVFTVDGVQTSMEIQQYAALKDMAYLNNFSYSTSKGAPTAVSASLSSIACTWDVEPQVDYYTLELRELGGSQIAEIEFAEGESSYTFTDLELTPGQIYYIYFERWIVNRCREGVFYYFQPTVEDPWILVDDEASVTCELNGDEDYEYFEITSNGMWAVKSNNDWIMVYDESLTQGDLDEYGESTADYCEMAGISGELMCISVLANPDGIVRTGSVTITSCGETYTIPVTQYQSYELAQLTSPTLATSKSSSTTLPYGDVTLQWNTGSGVSGDYQVIVYESDTQSSGYDISVYNEKFSSCTSCTIPVSVLQEGYYYEVYLKTEIIDGEYQRRTYYFNLGYEDALTLTASLRSRNVLPGEAIAIDACASGGAGDYVYTYILYKDDTEVKRSSAEKGIEYYTFTVTESGDYHVMVYVQDADGTVASCDTGTVTVDLTVSTVTPAPDVTIAPDTTVDTTVTPDAGSTITPAPTGDGSLEISQNIWSLLNPSAAWLNLTITSGGAWTISELPDWISVSNASGSGSETVSFYASYNSGLVRSAEILISGTNETKTLYVTQVGNDAVAQVTDVTVSDDSPKTGETVIFTVLTENADEVLFVVDGIYHDTIAVENNKAIYSRSFSEGGEREVYFVPRRDGAQGLFSDALIMNVQSDGTLPSPILSEIADVEIGSNAVVDWPDVENADFYAVYLYQGEEIVYKKSRLTESKVEIGYEYLLNTGAYTLLVMPCATGYSQSEGAAIFEVIIPDKTYELLSPTDGNTFDVGNEVYIDVSNPDGYLLEVTIEKDGKTVFTSPQSGPIETESIVDTFVPTEGGEYDIRITAYGKAGEYIWADDVHAQINVNGPGFESGSYFGTGARGMFTTELTSFRIVTNTAVSHITVDDGINQYPIEQPSETTSDWKHVFIGTLNAPAEGKHVYTVTAYDDYDHSVSKQFTCYAVTAVTAHLQYPQATNVKITEAPDKTSALETLYPSDSITVIGECGNYYYVKRNNGRRGFVHKDYLDTSRITTWDGLTISFAELNNANLYSYLKDGIYTNFRWECNIKLPSTAKYRLALIDHYGSSTQIYFGEDTSTKVYAKELGLSAGPYTALLEVVLADGSIVYSSVMSPYEYTLRATFGEYLKDTSSDLYHSSLNDVYARYVVLRDAHKLFTADEPFVDSSGILVTPIDIGKLTDAAVAKAYAKLSGNSEYAAGILKSAYIAESVMMSLSYYNGKTTDSIPMGVFNAMADALGIAENLANLDLYTQLREYDDWTEDYLEYMFKSKSFDWTGIVSGFGNATKYANDLINAYNKYLYYSCVDKDALEPIILAFSSSDDIDLKLAAENLEILSNEDKIWNYLLGSYGFKKGVDAYQAACGYLFKEALPKEWALTIDACIGVNDLVMNISSTQQRSYEALWAIEAADSCYNKVIQAYNNLYTSPELYFDDFVASSRVFAELVALEYEAFASFSDAVNSSALNKVVNWIRDVDGSVVSVTFNDIADSYRTIMEYGLEDFYINCLLPYGYTSEYY